jgi:hypothetical protein
MALPKDKRHTEEQAAAFAKKATQQNQFHRSRRDPDYKFRRDPYQKVMGWVLPRSGKSYERDGGVMNHRHRVYRRYRGARAFNSKVGA